MRILRTLLILNAAVVMTACATSIKQPQMRIVGVDGLDVQQVVPMGVAPSEPAPAPAEQVKPGEKWRDSLLRVSPMIRSGA